MRSWVFLLCPFPENAHVHVCFQRINTELGVWDGESGFFMWATPEGKKPLYSCGCFTCKEQAAVASGAWTAGLRVARPLTSGSHTPHHRGLAVEEWRVAASLSVRSRVRSRLLGFCVFHFQ